MILRNITSVSIFHNKSVGNLPLVVAFRHTFSI